MSAMSELFIDIESMLLDNVHPDTIATLMNIPNSMVYDVLESIQQEELAEELSPFETVNS